MKQVQNCPLCNSKSTYTYESASGKTVKKILCPKCTRLVFEENTEDRISSALQDTKDKYISKAVGMNSEQVLAFYLDKRQKSLSTGQYSITGAVVPRANYL